MGQNQTLFLQRCLSTFGSCSVGRILQQKKKKKDNLGIIVLAWDHGRRGSHKDIGNYSLGQTLGFFFYFSLSLDIVVEFYNNKKSY